MKYIEKLISGIENNNIIAIDYQKDGISNLIQVIPIKVFIHNQKEYLLAEETRTQSIKTYLLSNVEKIELTSLKYDKVYKNPLNYINKAFFKNTINIVNNSRDIQLRSIKDANRFRNIVDYMLESIRSEKINDIKFYDDSKEIFRLDPKTIIKLIKKEYLEASLPNDFKYTYSLWDRKIKKTPELAIYIGYPNLRKGNIIFPILYFKCKYNVDNNSILDVDKGYLNEQLFDEVIGLTQDEINDLVSEGLNLEEISSFLNGNIEDYHILDIAYIFLNRDVQSLKSVIRDIKSIENESIHNISKPLFQLFSCEATSTNESLDCNSFMVVESNEAQEKAVRMSQSNNITVVQGPPGTGKTQTIINIIITNLILGKKTIVTSTNNKAVDNVFEKLNNLNLPKFYLRFGNKNVREELIEQFDIIIEELKKIKTDNKDRIEDIFSMNEELIIKDQKSRGIYNDLIEKYEEYIELNNKLIEIQNNLGIEFKKIMLRGRGIPSEELYNDKDSSDILNIMSSLDKLFINTISKQNGKWSLLERFFGLFVNKEKRFLNKMKVDYQNLINTDDPINSIDDLLYIISLNIDKFRYAFTKKFFDETKMKIENININEIKVEIENVKKERIDYARQLVLNKIILNLESTDLDEIDINTTKIKKYKELTDIFPVVLCTNLSVPNSIVEGFKFDVGIIDEASQCDIPASIPTIKRSESLLVIGDDQQLNPITKIDSRLDDYNLEKYEVSRSIRYRDNSIFDAFKKISKDFSFLDRHYRSKKTIIEFSNKKFYDNKLKIMRDSEDSENIKLVNVLGRTEYSRIGSKSAYNRIEIKAIMECLYNLRRDNYLGSIGIITPFRSQKDFIEEAINSMEDKFYSNIDVGTVHTFQGHEKDLIIFSSVVSRGSKNGSVMWLNKMEKLLNVAITRARDYFILICDERRMLETEGILKELVEYINSIGTYTKYEPTSIFDTLKLRNYCYEDKLNIKNLLNPYEEKMYVLLKDIIKNRNDLNIHTKTRVADVVNIDKYKNFNNEKFGYGLRSHFDFVILKNENGLWPLCAIELDGKTHSNDGRTVYRDGLKDLICEDMNLKLIRVKTDDFTNFESNIRLKIQEILY